MGEGTRPRSAQIRCSWEHHSNNIRYEGIGKHHIALLQFCQYQIGFTAYSCREAHQLDCTSEEMGEQACRSAHENTSDTRLQDSVRAAARWNHVREGERARSVELTARPTKCEMKKAKSDTEIALHPRTPVLVPLASPGEIKM